jgi:hypothetical protein
MRRITRLLAVLLLVGIGAAGASAGRDPSPPATALRSQGLWISPDPVLVGDLDALIQRRFAAVTEEDVREGRFGLSRIIRPRQPSHPLLLAPDRSEEELVVKRLSRSGWRTAMYLVGEAAVGDSGLPDVAGPIFSAELRWNTGLDLASVDALGKKVLGGARDARATSGALALQGRAIPASNPGCLLCHRRKKLGEPIGAIVYAFQPAASVAGSFKGFLPDGGEFPIVRR